jgi:hypothetical protein
MSYVVKCTMARMKTLNKQANTCEFANNLEISLKTTRFYARGDKKWTLN